MLSPTGDNELVSSRRAFLKTSAGVVAATSLASLASPVHAGVDETLKIALVGCGNRGAGAAANALQTSTPVKLWAMADAFRDRLDKSLGALQSTGATVTPRVEVAPERQFIGLNAYKQAIDCCDVAILAGPPGFRPEHFAYAVERGKHVFMEKPVATDAPGVRRVLATAEAAKRQGLKVGVGLQRRHDDAYAQTIGRLHDGAIGDIRTLRCYWNGGTIKIPVPHAGLTEMEYQVRNWYFFHWLSGDHIVEQHIHNLDVCNWVMNAHPISAMGMGGRQMRTGKDYGDIFDHHAVEYAYPNGVRMFSYCRQIPGCEPLIGEFAAGARGDADIGKGVILAGSEEWRYPRPRGAQRDKEAGRQNPYQVEHEDLFKAIRDNSPYHEAENGAVATMTAILGRMATYTGRTVGWDDGFNSTQSLMPSEIGGWDTLPLLLPDADGRYKLPAPGLANRV